MKFHVKTVCVFLQEGSRLPFFSCIESWTNSVVLEMFVNKMQSLVNKCNSACLLHMWRVVSGERPFPYTQNTDAEFETLSIETAMRQKCIWKYFAVSSVNFMSTFPLYLTIAKKNVKKIRLNLLLKPSDWSGILSSPYLVTFQPLISTSGCVLIENKKAIQ